jgi:serine/threonine protein kinase
MSDDHDTRDDWGKLFELLDTALELPPAERESWLQQLAEPPALKDRLRQLLSDRSRFHPEFMARPAMAELQQKPVSAASSAPAAPAAPVPPAVPAVNDDDMPTGVRDISILPRRVSGGGEPCVGMKIKDGRYTLVEELGKGGMGHVFKASDERKIEAKDRNPFIALKVLSEDFKEHPDAFIALQREGKRAQDLAHPNVITVHDFDRDGPLIFMTMEYLQGKTLDEHLRTDFAAGLSVAAAWPLIEGIGAALAYGHSKKIIHSDLKPNNIFVCRDGNVKVLDFGIARPMSLKDPEGELTTFDPGKRLGGLTPAYAALEMWSRDEADPRDDIYAFACVTYELLAGKHPFGRMSARTVRDEKMAPKRIDSINRAQWEALRKGLALHRDHRTPTVVQFIAPFRPTSFLRRYGLSVSGAAAVVAIAALVLGAHYFRTYVEDELIGDPSDTAVTGPAIPLTPAQKLDVTEKLSLANEFLEGVTLATTPDDMVSALSEGPNNVNQIVGDVLTTDPGNKDAVALQRKIADLYERKARKLADAGDTQNAAMLVKAGLRVRPKHGRLFRLQSELCRANAC